MRMEWATLEGLVLAAVLACALLPIASSPTNDTLCSSPDDTLFQCGNGTCIIPAARCDGFEDCSNGQDEMDCETISCPEDYRCHNSTKCVFFEVVCDGKQDCAYGDDEEECDNKRCPDECICSYINGEFTVRCTQGWNLTTVNRIPKATQMLQLSEAENMTSLQPFMFKGLSHLKTLSLRDNRLRQIPPSTFFGINPAFMDISNNDMTSIEDSIFKELGDLDTLILQHVPLIRIGAVGLEGLQNLKTILISKGNKTDATEVSPGALKGLVSLKDVYVDDYRLCCDFTDVPTFSHELNCHCLTLQSPLNLCGSMMQTNVQRGALWALGLGALIGNVGVLVWRLKFKGDGAGKTTHSFMVMNLAVSDFLMGVYMFIIATADIYFGETYFRIADEWRCSVTCKIAGVLSMLSSEASVFFVTLISIDCFLCIVFPFRRIHLQERSSKIVVALLWVVAVIVSVVPIRYVIPRSVVYGLSDVCIGLPFSTRANHVQQSMPGINDPLGNSQIHIDAEVGGEPKWIFSVVVFLGVNLICFLVVFSCYLAIFISVKRASKRVRVAAHRDREIRMAVKMALIVGTDFACWMPVIVMGILSQTNTVAIKAEAYGWIVVCILPINSSLNPILYTAYTAILARRSRNGALPYAKERDTPPKTISGN